ncbi:MAG: phosphatase PAP2 family protein [Bacteriovorax sp.]|nr:phosphatase PAP2 family protein [Bacteriovorax sp.]
MIRLLSKLNEFDRAATLAVAKWRTKEITFILKMATYTARGYAWGFYVIVLVTLNQKGIQIIVGQYLILKAMICTFMTWVIGNIIKQIFRRKRPFQAMANLESLVYSPKDDSFPSLHTASTTAFFTALLLIHHPWALWVGVWAAIVTFSRLYLGVHYLSDLFGGILLGIFCGYLVLIF